MLRGERMVKDPSVYSRRSCRGLGTGTRRWGLRMLHGAVSREKRLWGMNRERNRGVLTAQAFILILTVGTGANTVTHPVGWDAVSSVMA